MKEIKFEELAKFSSLPETISYSSDEVRYKTKNEILREFNLEKWAEILDEVKKNDTILLQDIDCKFEEFEKLLPFFFKNKFYLGTGRQIFERHIEIFKNAIDPYVENASSLVELGAGYGSKILNLSIDKNYDHLPLYAGELTNNGCDAIKILAKRMNKVIKVGHCDLKEGIIEGMKIPRGSIIFTSYATHYARKISSNFIDFILGLDPKIVINFEPCYESHVDSKYGLMCKQYIRLNDYNLDIISVLEESRQKGKIHLEVIKNVIGGNPFLPISILKWNRAA